MASSLADRTSTAEEDKLEAASSSGAADPFSREDTGSREMVLAL